MRRVECSGLVEARLGYDRHVNERDVWLAATPLAILARLSIYLRRLPVGRRGPVAAACLALVTAALAFGAWTAWS